MERTLLSWSQCTHHTHKAAHPVSSLYNSHNASALIWIILYHISKRPGWLDVWLSSCWKARGAYDNSLIPEHYLLTAWFRCIVPAHFTDYRPWPMRAFSKAIWGHRQQQLLCSTHFKQNAKTALLRLIRWRGDQNPLLLPYQTATGCCNNCSCMLKADPHIAKTYFHAPCEVMRLEYGITIHNFLHSYKRKSHLRCNFITEPNGNCV